MRQQSLYKWSNVLQHNQLIQVSLRRRIHGNVLRDWPCGNGAACANAVNSYTCPCVAGYTGTNCETDIGECASSPCGNGATCTDAVNSYTCRCVAGYTGTHCEADESVISM
ncbi:hypothetical protein NP493_923g00027 [Ridgeia piscesae]|uniref:EGF-like domain-containing protein n=1 Tax=Ridgeia piscesae TaxID=27915 RepID=A0AAD9NMS3_RIDPI|nr:hypothetical protein NP493_923g00027 [Ridgeia piscesae]